MEFVDLEWNLQVYWNLQISVSAIGAQSAIKKSVNSTFWLQPKRGIFSYVSILELAVMIEIGIWMRI